MNTSNIKKYAPKARREFIDAVTKRLNLLGIHADKKGHLKISEAQVSGGIMQIDGNSFNARLEYSRHRLVEQVQQQGVAQLVEHTAYTWFNRLCAIRYMELHGYLEHGFRVLSHPDKPKSFQILDHAQYVADDLGLDRDRLVELKLAGTKDEELYRELLIGQCHKLHEAMPFLFEALDDEAELLLPDNLIRTDSILRGLVDNIPENDWEQVEVIGWLYQFYISEKKDQVIGNVVNTEDIPAATQLFTPNWIVKYLVQNSVGRQWLQTYPDSDIKAQMEYYIEPAQQSDEMIERLKAITPESIEPESIKVLDPACGSGHILLEVYNVLKAIYEERGFRSRDIPKLILENNLFGLDIDDRAAQLAGFALMMKARLDDRRIFTRNIKLNILSLQGSGSIDLPHVWRSLNLNAEWRRGISDTLFDDSQLSLGSAESDSRYGLLQSVLKRFRQAKTFGSLIDIPADEFKPLTDLLIELQGLAETGDSMQRPAASSLMQFIQQARILAQRYNVVVANPPYMGEKYQTSYVKKHLKENYKGYEKDLFSAFIIRNLQLANDYGQLGFMTPFVWMFISSYEQLRAKLIDEEVISTLVQLEYSGFDGATVPICAFTLTKGHISDYKGSYIRLSDFRGAANQGPKTLEAIRNRNCGWLYEAKPDEFKKIPGSPIAFWVPVPVIEAYSRAKPLKKYSKALTGMRTGDNERFLREWHEVSFNKIGLRMTKSDALASGLKWFPYNKGGGLKKWYGNNNLVVNWQFDGNEIKELTRQNYPQLGDNLGWKITNENMYFTPGITWGGLTSSFVSFRWSDLGALFDSNKGAMMFPEDNVKFKTLALLSSPVTTYLLNVVNPTLSTQNSDIDRLPVISGGLDLIDDSVNDIVVNAIEISRKDESFFEKNIEFSKNPLVSILNSFLIKESVFSWLNHCKELVSELSSKEEEINSLLIKHYGFDSFLSPTSNQEHITLNVNPVFKYSGTDEEQNLDNRYISDLLCELISYSIGCMMGRYSLDHEGLVYAHSGNEGFAELVTEGVYRSFPADNDGILPLTDQEWFKDDACNRFREFVRVVWGEERLQENLNFVSESLCLYTINPKRGESGLETIRRYLSSQFYKDHLKTYKKRPIYWLFSSGKQQAFECLVYLHRYNESTLSRMRTEYVTPLLGKYSAYAEQLQKQKEDAASTTESNRLKKELDVLNKKQIELREFDDKLKHYADMRITLDLDDGVKVNYGKFGDLLFDVKGIAGNAPEVI